jgi:4-carboxymuconolactone decarboxylase
MKMKDAKTGREMLESWQELVGDGDIDDIKQVFNIFAEKMPSMLARFTQEPLVESMARGALDPKTRELVLLGMLAAMQCGPGIVFHVQGAVHAGATEEEILEVMFLSAYEHAKVQTAAIGQSLEEGLKRARKMKSAKSRGAKSRAA